MDIEYIPISSTKFDYALHYLRDNFTDEPLSESLGLYKPGPHWELFLECDRMTLEQDLSVMAVDKELGVIAGISLNGIFRRGDVEHFSQELNTINNLIFKRLFGLINSVNRDLDLFEKYNVDKIFEIQVLSVDKRYRRRGIAKELIYRSECIAEEHGFKLMKVDTTSLFSQTLCENYGFNIEKSARYSDYKDENGKLIYNTKFPHEYISIMVKQLLSKHLPECHVN